MAYFKRAEFWHRTGSYRTRPLPVDPQPHKGTIFFTDLYRGLWAVRLLSREDSKAKTTSMQ